MVKQKWHWDTSKVVEVLTMKNAHAAMRGKPCPVAASVVEKLEKVQNV